MGVALTDQSGDRAMILFFNVPPNKLPAPCVLVTEFGMLGPAAVLAFRSLV